MKIKNVLYAMLCICVAFVISGCGKNEKGKEQPTVTPTPTYTSTPTNGPDNTPTETPDVLTIAPPENMEVT
ncbi:MAG: hypothetical protein IJ420_04500, partial [Lachnospiraceae bacterium]|nr:hypothetical protein [Lachnospiraceae bacterium]